VTDDIGRAIIARLDEVVKELKTLREQLAVSSAADPPEFMTVKEAAAYFRISERALYRLSHLKIRGGGPVRFRRSKLERHFSEEDDWRLE
jgi:hypothetical protein